MTTEFTKEDVELEDWIEKDVSFLQAEVKIFRDPGMFAQYGPIMQEIKALEDALKPVKDKKERSLDEESLGGEQAATFADESLGDETKSEAQKALDEAREKAKKLYEQYEKNSELWVLRRLNEEEVVEVKAGMDPLPQQPVKPSSTKMSQAQKEKALQRMIEWNEQIEAYRKELRIKCLPLAVVSITLPGGKVLKSDPDTGRQAISEGGVRRLVKRPGGDAHFTELVEAMESLTISGVSIMAPHRDGAGA